MGQLATSAPPSRDPGCFRAWDKISTGPFKEGIGRLHHHCCLPGGGGGAPTLHSGTKKRWHIAGLIGYNTAAVWGIPSAAERVSKSELTRKWVDWLHHPCLLMGPQRFRACDKTRVGPKRGALGTSSQPSGGSTTLASRGWNQNSPINRHIGYITHAVHAVTSRGKNQNCPLNG